MADSSDSVSVDMETIYLGGKIFCVSKDCSFVLKPLLCCFIISASTISVLPGMSWELQQFVQMTLFLLLMIEQIKSLRLGAVMLMGAMVGAYIVTLFAMKYGERVLGLILISPLCKAPSWSEWLCNKLMSNLLYFYGTCHLLKDCLLYRHFSKELRGIAGARKSQNRI